MIEDALSVTRNLHRLIITASLITIVFSLSLRYPEDIRRHQEAVRRFLDFKFTGYEGFVQSKADEAAKTSLKASGDEIRKDLQFPLIFGLNDLADAIEKPFILGRFHLSETKLSNPSQITLQQLELLSESYPLKTNFRIAVPVAETLAPQLREFLTANGKTGMRVQTVRLESSEFYGTTEAPSDGDVIKMVLTFELVPVGGPPIPVFQGQYDARVSEVSGTSFHHWLSTQPNLDGLAQVEGDQLKWLPALDDLPRELAERELGGVYTALTDQLAKDRPENKSVSLLGADIPGTLLVYASPIALLSLILYFISHLHHLTRFAQAHRPTFEKFAWLPLSLDRGWIWEAGFTLGLLPVASLIALGVQLWRLGVSDFIAGMIGVLALVGILGLCWKSLQQLALLRAQVDRPGYMGLFRSAPPQADSGGGPSASSRSGNRRKRK